MKKAGGTILWLALCTVAGTTDVSGAEQDRVGSAAATVTWSEFERNGQEPGLSAGAAASIEARVTPRVALMVRAALWPNEAPARLHIQGGHTVNVFGGLRADVLKRRRSAVYAGVLLGVTRASAAIVTVEDGAPRQGAETLFAVGGLLGLEVNPTERWLVRVELGRTQVAVDGTEVGRSGPADNGAVLIVTVPPTLVSRTQMSVGAGIRFGSVVPGALPRSGERRWHIVPQLTYAEFAANTAPRPNLNVDRGAALGLVTTYDMSRHVGLEGEVSTSLQANAYQTPFYGGHELQMMAGVRIGGATERLGVFGKAGGGLHRYSSVVQGLSESGAPDRYGALHAPAAEFGAVVDVYMRSGQVLRFGVANVFVRGPDATLAVPGGSVRVPSQGTTRRLQIAIGFGWTM